MTKREARKLPNGLYEIHWKDGTSSMGAVGEDHNGNKWLAPCDWVGVFGQTAHWMMVDTVVLIREDKSSHANQNEAR